MAVRPYRRSDLEQVMSVYHDAVHVLAGPFYTPKQLVAWAPMNTDPTRWQERLSRSQTFVMDAEGVIAGFASYEMTGHLDLLFTHPSFARKGVARQLCSSVERCLSDAGVRRMYTEASLPARPFFESQGFRVLEEETVECRGVQLRRSRMEKEIEAM